LLPDCESTKKVKALAGSVTQIIHRTAQQRVILDRAIASS
jgi:hypothetical protein